MLDRYPTVFIKPDKGSRGRGIIRVELRQDGVYEVCHESTCKQVNKESLMDEITDMIRPSRSYNIQQGIDLADYKGRPFDIRVFMQKPKNDWQISGKVIRVAARGQFLTNYHKGGKAATLERVFSRVLGDKDEVLQTQQAIDQISYATAKVLDARFPGIRQLGLDIALDKADRLWILEVNTSPAYYTFRKLRDKSMYREIRKNRRYIKKVYGGR
ncbi:hypothetical protein JIR001_15050 [Polycladomyces abyssicola]|uniref:YheC/YheD family protein n=2 Tax=Polycladomyces abyssicola TaxID=1125966 RepID=A0A8D5ZN95_9BACL|nr:hypothetical protein JIR001_15050 [Polycladomyces abyssicola]